jgi:hypothetical protein
LGFYNDRIVPHVLARLYTPIIETRPGFLRKELRMPKVFRGVAIAVLLSLGTLDPAWANPISSPSILAFLKATTLSFEDQGSNVGEEFNFGAGQPYSAFGLELFGCSVANVNIGSTSGSISVRSDIVYSGGSENNCSLAFSAGQRGVGFFYQDKTASSIRVMAFGINGEVLETTTLPGGAGYTGFLRSAADIFKVRTFAPHETAEAAFDSRTYIDDLTFGVQTGHLEAESEVVPGPSGSPGLILGLCERSPWLCHGVPRWPVVLWGPLTGAVTIAPLPRDPGATARLGKMQSDAYYRIYLRGLGEAWRVGVFDVRGHVAPFQLSRADATAVVSLHLAAQRSLGEDLNRYFLAFAMTAKGVPGLEYPVTARVEVAERPYEPPKSR